MGLRTDKWWAVQQVEGRHECAHSQPLPLLLLLEGAQQRGHLPSYLSQWVATHRPPGSSPSSSSSSVGINTLAVAHLCHHHCHQTFEIILMNSLQSRSGCELAQIETNTSLDAIFEMYCFISQFLRRSRLRLVGILTRKLRSDLSAVWIGFLLQFEGALAKRRWRWYFTPSLIFKNKR